jgi:hypothetical protein
MAKGKWKPSDQDACRRESREGVVGVKLAWEVGGRMVQRRMTGEDLISATFRRHTTAGDRCDPGPGLV